MARRRYKFLASFLKGAVGTGLATYKMFDDQKYRQALLELRKQQYATNAGITAKRGELIDEQLRRARDPEFRAADLELKRANTLRTSEHGLLLRGANERQRALQNQQNAPINVQPIAPPSTDTPVAPGPQSALPQEEPTSDMAGDYGGYSESNVASNEEWGDDPSFQTSYADLTGGEMEDVQSAAHGGLIKRRALSFADGGLVDEESDPDEEEGDDDLDDMGAGYGIGEAAGGESRIPGMTTIGGNTRSTPDDPFPGGVGQAGVPKPRVLPSGLEGAARQGLLAGMRFAPPARNQRGTGQNPQAVSRYLQADGSINPKELEAIQNAVDPKGELTPGQRTLAAYGVLWDYAVKTSQDPREAAAGMYGMLQANRELYNHYSTIARVAYENGKLDDAAKAAAMAYANIPNAESVTATLDPKTARVMLQVTDDKTGKVTEKKLLTPEEMGAYLSRMTPDMFDKVIAAGNMGGEKTTPKKALTLRDRKAASEETDTEVLAQASKYDEKAPARSAVGVAARNQAMGLPADVPRSPRDTGTEAAISGEDRLGGKSGSAEAQHIAAQIFATNEVSKGVAAQFATDLAGLSTAADKYSVQRMADGGARVTDRAGRSVLLDPGTFRQLAVLRGANNRAVQDKLATDEGALAAKASATFADVEGNRRKREQLSPRSKALGGNYGRRMVRPELQE